MILEHYIYYYFEEIENIGGEIQQPYIFLEADKNDEISNIVAQAISLDIRGNYGDILSALDDKTNDGRVKWSGNLFCIIIDKGTNIVKIIDLMNEDKEYITDFSEWNEALLDWKDYYLNELGFLAYDSKALSHMLGVVLLTFDQINEHMISEISEKSKGVGKEMITEAVKKCAKRYGVKDSVIYQDCRKVTGVTFPVFSRWLTKLLLYKQSNIYEFEYIMYNLKKYINNEEEAIDVFFKKYFLINLNDVFFYKY
jgi:hypothetical protein